MTDKMIAFISGANRGIGAGLASQLAQKGHTVFAGYRDESRSTELMALAEQNANLKPVRVDITQESDLEALHSLIANEHGQLDLVVNNAAVNLERSNRLNDVAWDNVAENFRVNVGGPFLTSKYLYPLLKKGQNPKIINISSGLGSLSRNSGGTTPYRLSKAALNMLTMNQAIDYKADGIAVACVNPGWVRTDMGGPNANLSVQESVERLIQNIERLNLSNSGSFLDTDGGTIPW